MGETVVGEHRVPVVGAEDNAKPLESARTVRMLVRASVATELALASESQIWRLMCWWPPRGAGGGRAEHALK